MNIVMGKIYIFKWHFISVQMKQPFLVEIQVYWHQMASLITFGYFFLFNFVWSELCVICEELLQRNLLPPFSGWKMEVAASYTASQLRRLNFHYYENLRSLQCYFLSCGGKGLFNLCCSTLKSIWHSLTTIFQ